MLMLMLLIISAMASASLAEANRNKLNTTTIPIPNSSPQAAPWIHPWNTGADMLWADFGANLLLTDEQANFIAKNYAIVSLEKCFGRGAGLFTEDAFAKTSAQLKAASAEVKILFYWHATVEIVDPHRQNSACYRAGNVFVQHPEWWLRGDDNNPIKNGALLIRNLTLPDVKRYMIETPLKAQAVAPQNFDGVFYDGSLQTPYVNMSEARSMAQNQAVNENALAISQTLSALAHSPGSHQVIGNGLAEYHNGNNGFPADEGLGMVPWMDGVCVEHWGAFEMTNSSNCSLIPSLTMDLIMRIQATAALNKSVLVKGWPGPVSTPIDQFGPSIPSSCNIGNGGESHAARAAISQHWFEPSYALFLLVADVTVYWSYSWWYNVMDGYYPAMPDANSSAPAEWFPMLKQPLGAPLGPVARIPGGSGWVVRREFAHAVVTVDLANYSTGTVSFH